MNYCNVKDSNNYIQKSCNFSNSQRGTFIDFYFYK